VASLVRFRYSLPGCLPPCTDQTGILPQPPGTFTSRLSTDRSSSPLLDITTTATGLLCWRDSHPLEWQLASLHGHSRPGPTSSRPANVCYASDCYRNGDPLKPTKARSWARIELYGITLPKIAAANACKIEAFGELKCVCKKNGIRHSVAARAARAARQQNEPAGFSGAGRPTARPAREGLRSRPLRPTGLKREGPGDDAGAGPLPPPGEGQGL